MRRHGAAAHADPVRGRGQLRAGLIVLGLVAAFGCRTKGREVSSAGEPPTHASSDTPFFTDQQLTFGKDECARAFEALGADVCRGYVAYMQTHGNRLWGTADPEWFVFVAPPVAIEDHLSLAAHQKEFLDLKSCWYDDAPAVYDRNMICVFSGEYRWSILLDPSRTVNGEMMLTLWNPETDLIAEMDFGLSRFGQEFVDKNSFDRHVGFAGGLEPSKTNRYMRIAPNHRVHRARPSDERLDADGSME